MQGTTGALPARAPPARAPRLHTRAWRAGGKATSARGGRAGTPASAGTPSPRARHRPPPRASRSTAPRRCSSSPPTGPACGCPRTCRTANTHVGGRASPLFPGRSFARTRVPHEPRTLRDLRLAAEPRQSRSKGRGGRAAAERRRVCAACGRPRPVGAAVGVRARAQRRRASLIPRRYPPPPAAGLCCAAADCSPRSSVRRARAQTGAGRARCGRRASTEEARAPARPRRRPADAPVLGGRFRRARRCVWAQQHCSRRACTVARVVSSAIRAPPAPCLAPPPSSFCPARLPSLSSLPRADSPPPCPPFQVASAT